MRQKSWLARQSAVTAMSENLQKKLCETVEQTAQESRAGNALDKLCELVNCGDKRIELSSAKEVLNLLGLPENLEDKNESGKLEVEIKIV